MTSRIIVNNIQSDAGVSTVFFNSDIGATSGTLNLAGNLNVSGVVTYDDVTNIDSVGLITARSGVHVGTESSGTLITGNSTGIGIGTDAPDRLLHLSSNTNTRLKIATTSASSFGQLYLGDEEKFIIGYGSSHPNEPHAIALKASNSSGYISLFTGGDNERLRITSDGKIVTSGGAAVGTVTLAGDGKDMVFGRTQNSGTGGVGRLVATGNIVYLQAGANASSGSAADLVFGNYGGVGERMRITSAGLMGVGTDNPATNLDVNGSLQLRASSNSGGYTNYATRIYSRLDSTHCTVIESYLNNSTAFEMMGSYADGGGANPRVVISAGGQKVGINETAPDRQLHVKSGANSNDGAFRIESATDNIMDMGTDGTGHFLNCVNADPFRIKFAGTERLRIDSSGNTTLGKYTAPSTNGAISSQTLNFIGGGWNTSSGATEVGTKLQSQHAYWTGNYSSTFGQTYPDFKILIKNSDSATYDEKFAFSGNGVMRLQSGGGINFHNYGSGTNITSNVLDDYEEGTWTPIVSGTSGGSFTAGSSNYGSYVKVGRMVTASATIHWTSASYAGLAYIGGLPFASNSTSLYRAAANMPGQNNAFHATGSFTDIKAGIDWGLTYAYVVQVNETATSGVTYNHSPTLSGGTGWIYGFAITYQTD